SAARTSSMRACELGMPSVWLPDIDPEASNAIIASSVQGEGFFSSSVLPAPLPAIRVVNAMTDNEKNAAGGMATAGTLKDHCSDLPIGLPTFTVGTCRAVSLRVAVEAHRGRGYGAGVVRGCVALEELDHGSRHVDPSGLLKALDARR